jgi:hypothetical protein
MGGCPRLEDLLGSASASKSLHALGLDSWLDDFCRHVNLFFTSSARLPFGVEKTATPPQYFERSGGYLRSPAKEVFVLCANKIGAPVLCSGLLLTYRGSISITTKENLVQRHVESVRNLWSS